MPKIKTHKGAQRRLRLTGTGKVMRRKIGGSHLRRNKPARVKRAYHGVVQVDSGHDDRLKALLPYR